MCPIRNDATVILKKNGVHDGLYFVPITAKTNYDNNFSEMRLYTDL